MESEATDSSMEARVDEETVLSAIPPRAGSRSARKDETSAEGGSSASEAFRILETLLQEGAIGGDRAARLKAKYMELYEALKESRDNETTLIHKAKMFTQEVAQQESVLEKADKFTEGDQTDVTKLRQELLTRVNELAQSEERHEKLLYDLYLLEEDKNEMQREYDRTVKPEDLEKQLKDLNKATEDLKSEIAQRTQEAKQLGEDIRNRQRHSELIAHEANDGVFKQAGLKDDLVKESSVVGTTSKQLDSLRKALKEMDQKKQQLADLSKQLAGEMSKLEQKKVSLASNVDDMNASVDQERRIVESKQRELQLLEKDYRMAKERADAALGDRATLDLNFQHALVEYKLQHETHARKVRERDVELKHTKRAELQLKHAQESLNQLKSVHERLSHEVEAATKLTGSFVDRQSQVGLEVDRARKHAAIMDQLSEDQKKRLEDAVANERYLSEYLKELRELIREGNRMITLRTIERDQKSREMHRIETRLRTILDDIVTKNNVIEESQKKNKELQIRLREYAQMYDVLKGERNKCVAYIQTTTQKAAEMREKIKILQNEVEILQASIATKDRLLQKSHLKLTQSVMVRDSIRNELLKQQRLLVEYQARSEQQLKNLEHLNNVVNMAEEQMVQLRKRFEQCVQERNERGVQLIERNEEVCIFYERLNVQESVLRNGDMDMQTKDEEVRFLRMEASDAKRDVDGLRKAVPNKRNIEDELVTVQIQLEQCRDRIKDLEKQLESPTGDRVRLLAGDDSTPEALSKKLELTEIRLADKEEQLLEKELVLEEVQRLCERAKKKADLGKADTLAVAKKVNEFQAKIKDTTRKMMAIVSELSMHQANALKLQHGVRERETTLEQCYLRMEQGQAPSDEIHFEWKKIEVVEHRKQKEMEMRRENEDEAEQYEISAGVYTTAEPRPNAYLPDAEGELPLPKPYGARAPFKPSEPGANIRHIRKPVQQPLEI
ncbi:coiled-coil domain-containing protein 146-like [Oscarella lobularis]|uniref:coiled-coil domain-containing protein 146-like n=1 Tax=Oscarella lobularis TaxID=121494 RepID=UPI0033134414